MAIYTTQRGEPRQRVNIFLSSVEYENMLTLSTKCKESIGNLLVRLTNQEQGRLQLAAMLPPVTETSNPHSTR